MIVNIAFENDGTQGDSKSPMIVMIDRVVALSIYPDRVEYLRLDEDGEYTTNHRTNQPYLWCGCSYDGMGHNSVKDLEQEKTDE